MVNDLNEQHERQQQLDAFIPRMKKWDYILTSSDINTTLLESAFMLNKNPNLKVLEYGAPKNEYLIIIIIYKSASNYSLNICIR